MKFTTIFNEEIDTPCAGCIVTDMSKFTEGRIYQTKLWDLSQDFEIAYPGMVVISPMRHVSYYSDLSKEELRELHDIITKSKKIISKIFNCDKFCNTFYEKPNGHVHFVVIPLHGLIEIKNKYTILGELMEKIPDLKHDNENMLLVKDTIKKMRDSFL